MHKSLLIGQVASLARDIEVSQINMKDFGLHVSESNFVNQEDSASLGSNQTDNDKGGTGTSRRGLLKGFDTSSRRAKLDELLGAWEEPELESKHNVSTQERQASSMVDAHTSR